MFDAILDYLDAYLIIFDKNACCVSYFELTLMSYDSAWEVAQVHTLTLLYDCDLIFLYYFIWPTSDNRILKSP